MRAIEKEAIVDHLRFVRSTCSTTGACAGANVHVARVFIGHGEESVERGVEKILSPDGEEGLLGIVVPPIGDQLPLLCAGRVDISLGRYPRESLFHSGFIYLLSFMDHLQAIYLMNWIIVFGYFTLHIPSHHTFSLDAILLYGDTLHPFFVPFLCSNLVFFAFRNHAIMTFTLLRSHYMHVLPAYIYEF